LNQVYPWGERRYWPYKMWLKALREHMAKFGPAPATIPHLSPLERQKLRGEAGMFLSEAELRRRGA